MKIIARTFIALVVDRSTRPWKICFLWDRALYTEKILKKSSLQQMFTEQYGWFSGRRVNRNAVRMKGRNPGFDSNFQRYTEDDVCIVVLGNNYAPTATALGADLAKIVFSEKNQIGHHSIEICLAHNYLCFKEGLRGLAN